VPDTRLQILTKIFLAAGGKSFISIEQKTANALIVSPKGFFAPYGAWFGFTHPRFHAGYLLAPLRDSPAKYPFPVFRLVCSSSRLLPSAFDFVERRRS
jgi:hypothetical protein